MNNRSRNAVFVSYARADDEGFVRKLVGDLRARGFEVWWDRDRMPSRGRSFLQELRDAVWSAGHIIAVLGPNALASPYVQAEWEHALLFSRAVVPVLRLGGFEDAPQALALLHTFDFRSDESYAGALDALVQRLDEPVPPLARLSGVPALPPHFLSRLELVRGLEQTLLADVFDAEVLTPDRRVAALVGLGGSGKSTLASVACRDTSTRRSFAGGIAWLSIGQRSDGLAVMNRLGALFERKAAPYLDTARAHDDLSAALGDVVVLLVLDVVWRVEDAEPFVALLGPRCRLLITTRDREIATSLGAIVHDVDVFDETRALALLGEWAGIEPEVLPPAARDVARACGYLPLALAISGGMARDGTPWFDIARALEETDLSFVEKKLPNYPHRDLLRALGAGVDFLRAEDAAAAEHYLDLAVLPRDVAVPESVLAHLWPAIEQDRDVRRLITTLVNKALLRAEGDAPSRSISLHTLQHDYLLAAHPALAAAHTRIADAYGASARGVWSEVADDGYVHRHLLRHLREGGRAELADVLVLDATWMIAKVRATDVASLAADLASATTSAKEAAGVVRDAVLLAAPVIAKDPSLLVGQIAGRLMSCDSEPVQRAIGAMQEKAAQPWLRARTPFLRQVGGPLRRVLERGTQLITAFAADVHETVLVTCASFETSAKVWNLETGTFLRALPGARRHAVMALRPGNDAPKDVVAVSPDGAYALTALNSGDLALWRLRTGERLPAVTAHEAEIASAVWRTDGRIVSIDRAGGLIVWDPETLAIDRRHSGATWILSPDGRRGLGFDGRLFEVDTGETIGELDRRSRGSRSRSTAVSGDGRVMLTIEHGGTARWWDFTSGALLGEVPELAAQPHSVALTKDGAWALIGFYGAFARWRVGEPQLTALHAAHTESITALALVDGERALLTASMELYLWDYGALSSAPNEAGAQPGLRAAVIHGARYATAADSGEVLVRDLETHALLHTAHYPTERPADGIDRLSFGPGGAELYIVTTEGLLAVHTLESWDTPRRFELGFVSALEPAAARVATRRPGNMGTLCVWDLATGAQLLAIPSDYAGRQVFTPDGSRIVVAPSFRGRVRAYELAGGGLVFERDFGSVEGLAVSPDSRVAAVAGTEQLTVFALDDGRILFQVSMETRALTGDETVVFTPDGRRLIAADKEGAIHVWAIETGALLHHLPNDRPVRRMRCSADGRRVASFESFGGTVHLWDLETGARLASFVAEGYLSSGELSADGRTIVAVDRDVPVILRVEECAQRTSSREASPPRRTK